MRALLYKEGLKLRQPLLLIGLGNLLFCGWLYLSIRHQFRIEHAEMLYYQASRIGRLFYADLRTVPLLSGLALAVAQFAPEVIKGRLRLSMHLPIGLNALMLGHIAIGLAALGLVLGLDLLALHLTMATWFPTEFAWSAVGTALPWMLAGLAGYLGLALAVLEPVRRYRIANLVVVLGGCVWLCHQSGRYGAYDTALWGLAALVALMVPAVLLPARRFRDGGS